MDPTDTVWVHALEKLQRGGVGWRRGQEGWGKVDYLSCLGSDP